MTTASISIDSSTEKELIAGCSAGNRIAQEQLYKLFSPRMFGLCLRYSGDFHAAEDILQEGFVKVYNNIDRYRHEGSFEGWMKRIFINTAIEHFRKAFRFDEMAPGASKEEQTLSSNNSWSGVATKELLAMVQKLSPGYRTVFNMYAIEGFSHKEISETLNITEGTSKSQLARARVILQKMIGER